MLVVETPPALAIELASPFGPFYSIFPPLLPDCNQLAAGGGRRGRGGGSQKCGFCANEMNRLLEQAQIGQFVRVGRRQIVPFGGASANGSDQSQ